MFGLIGRFFSPTQFRTAVQLKCKPTSTSLWRRERVIMLIINDSICRGGAGWDTHWFNSHESRLHIQVSSLQNINSSLFHPRNVQYSKTHSIQLTDINSGRLNQPSSHFTLSPTSGELRTSSRLDREGRDGSDSVDLVALSSSPTYPIEASYLLM